MHFSLIHSFVIRGSDPFDLFSLVFLGMYRVSFGFTGYFDGFHIHPVCN